MRHCDACERAFEQPLDPDTSRRESAGFRDALSGEGDPFVPDHETEDTHDGRAVLNLGPMDGRLHPIEGRVDELCVVMTDGQQHRYVRTDRTAPTPDGRLAVVFDWAGRYYGPT